MILVLSVRGVDRPLLCRQFLPFGGNRAVCLVWVKESRPKDANLRDASRRAEAQVGGLRQIGARLGGGIW